jgi:hypothetical protein
MSWFTKIADKLEENKDISKITEGIKRTVDEGTVPEESLPPTPEFNQS